MERGRNEGWKCYSHLTFLRLTMHNYINCPDILLMDLIISERSPAVVILFDPVNTGFGICFVQSDFKWSVLQ